MSYLSIPHGGDGSAKFPLLLNFAPSSSPGYVANVHAIAKDTTTGIFYMKTGTAATDWTPITGSLAYETDEDYYKDRARTLLASPRLTCWWWDDFLEPQGEKWTGTLGAQTTAPTKYDACGIQSMIGGTNGLGASALTYDMGGVGLSSHNNGNFIPGGTDGVWYLAFRAKMSGTENAAYADFGGWNLGTGQYTMFGDPSGTSNNWTYTDTTYGNISSTTANDGLVHSHELYRVSGVTHYLLDEVEIMSSTAIFPTSPCAMRWRVGSIGNLTTRRQNDVDWVAVAVGGNNPRTIT